jgi:two-component system nitrate/nitrite response regulator NarL
VVEAAIRIVVADAHPLFALGVRALVDDHPALEVVGEATDGEKTLQIVGRTRPDVLLLDAALERIGGLEVLNRLQGMKLPTRAVLVAAAIDGPELRTALIRGARGVLLKHVAGDLMIKCVRQVVKGEYWIGRDSVADLVDALRRSTKAEEPASTLSQRERDIVSAVLKGASNKDIAWQLGLGEQTVKNHLRRIFAKLHVANRVELAVLAMANQIADSGDRDRVTS